MNVIDWLQALTPAQVLVTLVLLPWITAGAVYAYAALTSVERDARAFDGDAALRAAAAQRWAPMNEAYVVLEAVRARQIAAAVLEFRKHHVVAGVNDTREQVALDAA